MANIKNHGVWVRYTPDPWPEGIPLEVMFSKRNSDGVDWYAFNHEEGSFTADTAKLILMRATVADPWRVIQANRDATFLFPQDGCAVMEVLDDTGAGSVQAYVGKVLQSGAFVDPPPAA